MVMATSVTTYFDDRRDVSKRSVYKLIGASIILTPAFAVAPFASSLIVLFVFIFAYYYLGIFVLPAAFAGLGLGYYLGKKRNPVKRFTFAGIGYLVGFVAGLEIVAWQLQIGSSALPGIVIALGVAGLLVSFIISKIGVRNVVRTDSTTIQPLGQCTSPRITNGSQKIRSIIIIGLVATIGITAVLPFILINVFTAQDTVYDTQEDEQVQIDQTDDQIQQFAE